MRGILNTDNGKEEKSQISDLSFYQKKLVKDKINPKKKENVKEQISIENGKTRENQRNQKLFQKTNKI